MKHLTTEQLHENDKEITDKLKGPLTNHKRFLLVADRKDIRAELERRKNESSSAEDYEEPCEYCHNHDIPEGEICPKCDAQW